MNHTRCRILIIDDSPEDRTSYCRLIGSGCENEYQFTEAASAAEGLVLYQDGLFDCLLLDYRLPDRDGLDILPVLIGKNGVPRVAIVMLTGQGDESVAVQAMKRGVHDYLLKDRVTGEALRRAIQTAVEKAALLQEIEAQRQQLQRLAVTDGLTALYNRRYFMDRLEEEIKRARRYEIPLSLSFLDLDYFKRINDTFGHIVGDKVLKAVADVLRRLRKSDFAARYGGEEFAILLTNTDLEGAKIVSERLRKAITLHVASSISEQIPAVTSSVGIAQWSNAMKSGEEWIAEADRAMYRAKRAGRDQVCCAVSETTNVSRRSD